MGSCWSGGVWCTAKWRKRTCVGALRLKRGSRSSGGVWRTAKRDSTRYYSSPPSSSSSPHRLLFIQPPPRATPSATVKPPLHGHPSTVYCSSNPPRGRPVHPALHTTGSCSSRGNTTGRVCPLPQLTVHPTPPLQRSLFIQRGSIDRLQLAAVVKESLDRVQLTAIDRSLGLSNA